MRKRIGWIMLLGAAVTVVGCEQTQRANGSDQQDQSASTYRSEPKRTIGWDQLRTGIDPVEVISLVGEPMDVKVSTVNTRWYYSNRGNEGPHVVFDTRTMKVERWRAPAAR